MSNKKKNSSIFIYTTTRAHECFFFLTDLVFWAGMFFF